MKWLQKTFEMLQKFKGVLIGCRKKFSVTENRSKRKTERVLAEVLLFLSVRQWWAIFQTNGRKTMTTFFNLHDTEIDMIYFLEDVSGVFLSVQFFVKCAKW